MMQAGPRENEHVSTKGCRHPAGYDPPHRKD
jgi:hypothetical protein